MTKYRIDYTITRRQSGEEDFTEIGFGSSGAWRGVDAALFEAQSIIQRREWETRPGMPDPDTVDRGDL